MSLVILAPYGEAIAVFYPASHDTPVDAIAKSSVPMGVPYLIVDEKELPEDATYRDAWTADFSSPDGHGEAATATAGPMEN